MVWPFGDRADTAVRRPVTTREERDRQADAEVDEFMKAFASPESQPKTIKAPEPAIGGIAPPIKQEIDTETLPDGRKVYEDGTIDIRPALMHPTSMNCQQAFDQAFYCQSLGGKFNDIYRYGGLQSCSEQWSAFWFCMRTRTLGDGEKARQTTEFYIKKDAKKRQEKGSSEDVWDIRTQSVRRAFWKDPDESLQAMSEQRSATPSLPIASSSTGV